LVKKTKNKAGLKSKPGLPPTEIIKILKKHYPDAHCALVHSNAFELLIATILSAQCTDERVNKVTPHVFKRWPTPRDLAEAPLEEIEDLIRSTNFYKTKAKNIKACAKALVDEHHSKVPQDMESLIALAGVGRKTANVVLGNAFDISSGIVVDTHVGRLSQRLGWTKKKTAHEIEQDLLKIIPKKDWILISHLLITHGRTLCKARRPLCESCFLFDHCPKKGV
jgi:endonuclease-3